MTTWRQWLQAHWGELAEGAHVRAELGELAHPRDDPGYPWAELWLAEPSGQLEDWALSLDDGSRIHVHVHADRFEVHRDAIDPAGGPVAALRHYVTEAPTGRAAVKAGGVAFLVFAARRALLR